MLSFLSTFTEPFLLALLSWPFLALFLTLPILVIQYRRYGKVNIGRGLIAYAFILYGLSLVSFTLYPMPSNPLEFCRDYNLSPQLIPFSFIHDIQSEGLRAILQVGMNLLFFVPLGVFCRLFFNLRFRTALLIGFMTSLFIETAQLTGAFGYYPCSYRLFDIDDLIINTLGAVIGYTIARLIPRREIDRLSKHAVIRKAGLVRYTVAFIIDQVIAYLVAVMVILSVYFIFGNASALAIRDTCFLVISIVVVSVAPLLLKGWSAGGWIVRLNHDDQKRTTLRRIIFYIVRAVMLCIIAFPPYDNALISVAVIVVLLIVWWRKKRLIYQYL